jgi:type I site-specific restriction endonuclease
MLPQLNLPSIETRLQESNGKVWIFDGIRKKFVVLTPEEWVRQHFIQFLVTENYPKSLIKVEGGLSVNDMKKRSDIVVYNREAKPWMVIECKNPLVAIDQATLQQVATYNSTLRADFVGVTNGLNHFYFRTDWKASTVEQIVALPSFPELRQ